MTDIFSPTDNTDNNIYKPNLSNQFNNMMKFQMINNALKFISFKSGNPSIDLFINGNLFFELINLFLKI